MASCVAFTFIPSPNNLRVKASHLPMPRFFCCYVCISTSDSYWLIAMMSEQITTKSAVPSIMVTDVEFGLQNDL